MNFSVKQLHILDHIVHSYRRKKWPINRTMQCDPDVPFWISKGFFLMSSGTAGLLIRDIFDMLNIHIFAKLFCGNVHC